LSPEAAAQGKAGLFDARAHAPELLEGKLEQLPQKA
jgi:hypothetical protein